MVKCSALQSRKTGGATDSQLPVGWMVNHREAQEGGREQGAEGEEEQEALEVEGWESPNLLPKGWTVRMPQSAQKMGATTALI